MKRRNFLKSIIGAISTVAVPSLALANPKLNQQILDSNALCSRPKMQDDNTSIWKVYWDEEGLSKIQAEDDSWKGIGDRYNKPLESKDLFSGLDVDEWMYRGWNIKYVGDDSDGGDLIVSKYSMTKDHQFIDLRVDTDLIDAWVDNGHGNERDIVESESDAYIEYAEKKVTSEPYKHVTTHPLPPFSFKKI